MAGRVILVIMKEKEKNIENYMNIVIICNFVMTD
jgi:hypothetical protein